MNNILKFFNNKNIVIIIVNYVLIICNFGCLEFFKGVIIELI